MTSTSDTGGKKHEIVLFLEKWCVACLIQTHFRIDLIGQGKVKVKGHSDDNAWRRDGNYSMLVTT